MKLGEGGREGNERESYLLPVFTRRNSFSRPLKKAKKSETRQRGDKVNNKMACKITGRYSVREEERGGTGRKQPDHS